MEREKLYRLLRLGIEKGWEVVQEYPYRGFRSSWLTLDAASEYMYVPASASHYVNKIDLATGATVWTTPTGTGPYGATLNADESEIWVADKGETSGMFGRTITVINTSTGRPIGSMKLPKGTPARAISSPEASALCTARRKVATFANRGTRLTSC